jgi:hypothetical protein
VPLRRSFLALPPSWEAYDYNARVHEPLGIWVNEI